MVCVVSKDNIVTLTTLNLLQAVEVDVDGLWDWCVGKTNVVVVLLAVEELIALDAARVWEASRYYASIGDAVLLKPSFKLPFAASSTTASQIPCFGIPHMPLPPLGQPPQ